MRTRQDDKYWKNSGNKPNGWHTQSILLEKYLEATCPLRRSCREGVVWSLPLMRRQRSTQSTTLRHGHTRAILGRSVPAMRFRNPFRITGPSTDHRARTVDPQKRRWLSTVGFSLVQNAWRLVEQRTLGRLLAAGTPDPVWSMRGGVGCPLNRISRVGRLLQFRMGCCRFWLFLRHHPQRKQCTRTNGTLAVCITAQTSTNESHPSQAQRAVAVMSGEIRRGRWKGKAQWRSTVMEDNGSSFALCDGFLKCSPHFLLGGSGH